MRNRNINRQPSSRQSCTWDMDTYWGSYFCDEMGLCGSSGPGDQCLNPSGDLPGKHGMECGCNGTCYANDMQGSFGGPSTAQAPCGSPKPYRGRLPNNPRQQGGRVGGKRRFDNGGITSGRTHTHAHRHPHTGHTYDPYLPNGGGLSTAGQCYCMCQLRSSIDTQWWEQNFGEQWNFEYTQLYNMTGGGLPFFHPFPGTGPQPVSTGGCDSTQGAPCEGQCQGVCGQQGGYPNGTFTPAGSECSISGAPQSRGKRGRQTMRRGGRVNGNGNVRNRSNNNLINDAIRKGQNKNK